MTYVYPLVFAMFSQKIIHCVPANHFPFSSLPYPAMKEIVEFVGGGFPDHPETYGDSLLVMVKMFPSSKDLVEKWVEVRLPISQAMGLGQ